MDSAKQIIKKMPNSWLSEFRAEIVATSDKTRVLDLLDAYEANLELTSKEYAMQLYKAENTNALYDLRRTLLVLLKAYIIKKRNSLDIQMPDTANAEITYALFCLENHLPELAKEPLDKAEVFAEAGRQYDTLLRLYSIKIKYRKALDLRMKDLSPKWGSLNKLATMRSILNNSNAWLQENIDEIRDVGGKVDEDELMTHFYHGLRQYVIDEKNPVLQFISVTAARTIFIASKNFQKIVPLIQPIYEELVAANAFTEADAEIQTKFIYYLTHGSYRSITWLEAAKWLDVLQSRLPKLAAERSPFYAKYILLAAAIATCTNQNALAIEMLEDALNKKELIANKEELVNMHLNLSVYYFQKRDYSTSEKVFDLIKVNFPDQSKKMGKEWRLKRDMIEMIIHYELGNDHLSRKLLKKMQTKYEKLFEHDVYGRANEFLNLIEAMLKDGTCVTTKEFYEQVQAAKKGWENTEDDLQAIAFFCWLKSKMVQRDYYEVLLERLQRPLRKAS